MVDLRASELHEGPGVVIESEIADDAKDERVIEGIGTGDGVEEGVFLEGLVASEDLEAELLFLGLEEPSALVQLETGGHTEPNRRPGDVGLYVRMGMTG